MRKHGVELSMNVIIIAAIALIVLVVLVLLVTNAGTDLRTGTGCVDRYNGQCTDLGEEWTCEDEYGSGWISAGKRDCTGDMVCCYPPFGSEEE